VKRIMQEARELANDPCTDYSAAPLEDDIFEWHCTLRGPPGTEFEGGLYHFRILLPAEYPFRPPSIMILTPNGRFELNTKICISFTSYHEELWQPAWGVRTAIIGLQGFFPLKGQAAVGVGSIEYPANERKRLAALSREWTCPICETTNLDLLPDPPVQDRAGTTSFVGEPHYLSSQPDAHIHTLSPHPVANASPSSQTPPPDAQISNTTSESKVNSSSAEETTEGTVPGRQVSASGAAFSGTQSINSDPPNFASRSPLVQTPLTPSPTPIVQNMARSHQSSQKPPLLLDSAICVLVVVVFTIICRRIV